MTNLPPNAGPARHEEQEWFAKEGGLRFACTMCGNCCSGPSGYVVVSDEESAKLASRLGLSVAEFERRYTHMTAHGRSLNETAGEHGLDCVFLDRTQVPGRAVCGVYEDRPAQCRTWPFWPSVVRSRQSWDRAADRVCPGMNTGPVFTPVEIRVQRDRFNI